MNRLGLTPWQRRRLVRQLKETSDARIHRRTLAVLEYNRGRSVADIASSLGVTRQSVYHWVETYAHSVDPSSLCDDARSGRPSLWTRERQVLLEALLSTTPDQCGYVAVNWTVGLLQDQLERVTGQRLSLIGQIRRLRPGTVLLLEDETDLLLFPPLRAAWARKGEPAHVIVSGRNASRVIFGALDPRTGRRLFLVREHGRSADFPAFLRALREHYPGRGLALVLDGDSSHTAKGSVALAARLGIRLLWLPKRAPELNPLEPLWGHAKDQISANRHYAAIEEQAARFVAYLESLPDQEALHLAAVLSRDFWLRSVL